jgi:hypothetical protein
MKSFISILLMVIFLSCKKSSPITLRGIYVEVSPHSGSDEFDFISNDTLSYAQKEGNTITSIDTFTYRIGDSSLTITPTWGDYRTGQLYTFTILDNSTFTIMFPAIIPEDPPYLATFKSQ